MNPSFDPTDMPLRDIHLPDAISWWPLAFGWWILVSIVFIGIILFAVRFYAARRQRAARRGIQKVIDALHAGQDPVLSAQQVSTIMRRFAMTISDEPDTVAGLTGEGLACIFWMHLGGKQHLRMEREDYCYRRRIRMGVV